jgi:hypothetical protein
LPKLRLVGFDVSCPGVTAVPDKPTFRVGLPAFEVIAKFPLTLPLEVGEKITLKLTL